jgi:hypothetical protein
MRSTASNFVRRPLWRAVRDSPVVRDRIANPCRQTTFSTADPPFNTNAAQQNKFVGVPRCSSKAAGLEAV